MVFPTPVVAPATYPTELMIGDYAPLTLDALNLTFCESLHTDRFTSSDALISQISYLYPSFNFAGPPGIQMQEMPNRPIADAAGEIQSTNGTWSPDLRERYADRVIAKLARQISNLPGAIQKRIVLSPTDLEAANPNLVGGDPYAGASMPNQFYIFRP